MVINPTFTELQKSDMDVTVAGTEDSIVMVEGDAQEISEQDMLAALGFAHDYIKQMCRVQVELAQEVGRSNRKAPPPVSNEDLVNAVRSIVGAEISSLAETPMLKEERAQKTEAIYTKALEALAEKYPEQEKKISEIIHEMEYVAMRQMILEKGKRLDGRGLKEIRPITIEVGLLPRTHGSALFQRGETQSLTS